MKQNFALVLGGGGSTANAWEIGVIAGLQDAGLDVSDAELIVGTSAGSTVAAQITAASPADLLAAVLATPPGDGRSPAAGPDPQRQATDHLVRMERIISAARDADDYRRRLGATAIASDPGADRRARRRAVVAARLPSSDWPSRPVRIVAVEARSGVPVVFDRDSGVDLVDAVTASCAGSGAPHRIGEKYYIDGAFRRNENADLAAGHARVLVLSPFGGRSLVPPAWGMHLAAQVAELQERGSRVEVVVPDEASGAVMGAGAGVMDAARRAPSARAGQEQGRRLTDLWR